MFTIGVYGFAELEFFQALKEHHINVFIDIRLRRGMRGKKYAFVNSVYLQDTLEHLEMRYVYAKNLAPSPNIRALQKEEDLKNHTTKQKREELSEPFVQAYKTTCLEHLDASQFLHAFDPQANLLLFWYLFTCRVAQEKLAIKGSDFVGESRSTQSHTSWLLSPTSNRQWPSGIADVGPVPSKKRHKRLRCGLRPCVPRHQTCAPLTSTLSQ